MQYNFTTIKSEVKDILLKEKGSKFIGFAFFLLLFIFSCKSNVANNKNTNYIPYYLEIYKADSLNIIGKKKEAFEKLDSLFKIYKPLNQNYLYEMSNYIRLYQLEKRKENIKPIIKSLIINWGINENYIKNDSLILLAVKQNNISYKKIKKWNLKFQRKLNKDYQLEMQILEAKDQAIRYKNENKNQIRTVDSLNYIDFKNLLKKYGYPTLQKVGYKSNLFLGAFYIHWANVTPDFEKNKNLIFTYVKSGEAKPQELASLISAEYLFKYNILFLGDDGEWEGFKNTKIIESKNDINIKRKNIGLPSLEYSLWKKELFNK